MYMSEGHKPIGWWLKHVDRRIEESFDRVLAAEGITRRPWQLLNTLGDGLAPAVALEPFLPTDPMARDAELAVLLDDLRARGWLDGDALGPEGRAARARIGEAVTAFRRRVTAGVGPQDHGIVIDTLRRMADNLAGNGPAPPTPVQHPT